VKNNLQVAFASKLVAMLKVAVVAFSLAIFVAIPALGQGEPTQILVSADGKSSAKLDGSTITIEVSGHKGPPLTWEPLAPSDTQVVLLIDDGVRETIIREMDNLRTFVRTLPEGMQVMIAYMQYGRVVAAQGFTTDHERAAAALHLPQGVPGASASPYVCLSDFVKNWPGGETASSSMSASRHKARVVLMISNGVDPYNGSTSILNQDSTYVSAAVTATQRAGVAVSAIYFGDSGINGTSANDSGQNYLSQVATNTGGISLWQGMGNPPSLEPYLKEFQQALASTYIAGFLTTPGRNPDELVRVKISGPHVKLHAPSEILPGNRE